MNFARPILTCSAALFLASCAGDNSTTDQSPAQPARFATSGEVGRNGNSTTSFVHNRIYQITRLEGAGSPRGEWRALGETIKQNGSTIEFIELGSGKTIAFTAPHQITPTNSKSDRLNTQVNSETPGQTRSEVPAPSAPRDSPIREQ